MIRLRRAEEIGTALIGIKRPAGRTRAPAHTSWPRFLPAPEHGKATVPLRCSGPKGSQLPACCVTARRHGTCRLIRDVDRTGSGVIYPGYRGHSSHITDTWCNKSLQAMPWSRAYHRHIFSLRSITVP